MYGPGYCRILLIGNHTPPSPMLKFKIQNYIYMYAPIRKMIHETILRHKPKQMKEPITPIRTFCIHEINSLKPSPKIKVLMFGIYS